MRGGVLGGAARGGVVFVQLVLAACTVTTEPLETLSATGTVTLDGDPAPANIRLTAGNYETRIVFPDGTYAITVGGGAIPTSACSSASIRAELLDADLETVLDEETRSLGSCGQHEIDFEF